MASGSTATREDREVESRSKGREVSRSKAPSTHRHRERTETGHRRDKHRTEPPSNTRLKTKKTHRRKRRRLVTVEAVDKKALDESKKACSLLGDASRAIANASNEAEKRGEKQVALGDAWQKSGLAKASSVAAYALDLLQNQGNENISLRPPQGRHGLPREQNLVRG